MSLVGIKHMLIVSVGDENDERTAACHICLTCILQGVSRPNELTTVSISFLLQQDLDCPMYFKGSQVIANNENDYLSSFSPYPELLPFPSATQAGSEPPLLVLVASIQGFFIVTGDTTWKK